MIEYDNGIKINGLEFNLDATRQSRYSFVSHGHSDHARKHRKIVATPETALLYSHHYPAVPARVMPYGRKSRIGDATVELFPSGHMLGAAQILIEIGGQRIVYTGDFKVYPNLTCTPLEVRRCDILITESTYGNPAYTFPPQSEVYARIVMFIKRCFVDGQVPVLVGYAMGKSQEAVMLAQQHGFEVSVDGKVAAINEVYRTAGVGLRPTENWPATDPTGKVLVVVPQTLKSEQYQNLRRKRSVFLSGWAQGGTAGRFSAADWSLPLSDHADYTQLIGYIEKCSPRKIYTLHGSPKFADLLRDQGFDAEHIEKGFTARPTARKSPSRRKVSDGENYELF